MMITSTAGSASSLCSASVTSATAKPPCTLAFSTRNRTAGQERQRPLARRGEQPFGGQFAAQSLQPGQQLTEAHRAQLERGQRERAAVDAEVGLGPDHHPGAFGRRGLAGLQHGTRADHPHRHGGDRVPQGQERSSATPGQLGDLPFDPDPAQAADPLADQAQDRPDRDG
jgi:hypothetical protein